MSQTNHPRRTARLDALLAGLLTARPRPVAQEVEQAGLWEHVAARAWQTRVGGLLIDHLRRHGVEPPKSAARQLDAYREHVRAANAYRIARVRPILNAFASEGVPFLVLKGAALNATLYADPGLRPMVDIDVMIRPRDAERVDRLMVRCGCSPGLELLREDFYPRFHYEREYLTPHCPPVKIDLHVRPFRPLRYGRTVPEDAMWTGAQTVTVDERRVRIPSAENMLIHLGVHAACHGLRELRWLFDIKAWMERFGDRIDWDELIERCRRWNVDLPMWHALYAVMLTFGEHDSTLAHALGGLARRRALGDKLALWQAPFGEKRPVCDVAVNFLCTPGMRFRLEYLKSALLPGPGHMGQIYRKRHSGWLLTAHAVRIIRGLTRPFVPAAHKAA
ncbi:MAG: nucleotidyltransferase family protein [Planctomycetota bacterium]